MSDTCESLRVIPKTGQKALPSPGDKTQRAGQSRVVDFPVFEHNDEQLLDWLAVLDQNPEPRTVIRLVKSMRSIAAKIARVKNSPRHSNLVSFIRQAANALEVSEWEGARYLLMTSHAVLAASPVSGRLLKTGCAEVVHFPAPADATSVELASDAMTGSVTG